MLGNKNTNERTDSNSNNYTVCILEIQTDTDIDTTSLDAIAKQTEKATGDAKGKNEKAERREEL